RIFLFPEPVGTPAGAWQRLVNLGYVPDPKPPAKPEGDIALERAVTEFQAGHGITPTGSLDDRTKSELKKKYQAAVPWAEEEQPDLPDDKLDESAFLRKDALA